jgi:hypothetical protein
VRGSAARIDDRLLAAQVPGPNAGSITVEIELPRDEAMDRSNLCNIGRLAEVRFQRMRFVDRLSRALGWRMGRADKMTSKDTAPKPVASQ